ncbi:ribonuclease H-like domain-containing protein [Tanacetum coccineum]
MFVYCSDLSMVLSEALVQGDDTSFLLLYVDDIRKYAMEILERAHMVGCNSSRTPIDTESKLGDGGTPVVDPTLYRSFSRSIQYLPFTRPDITYVVQHVCLYMHDPQEPHFSALKRILRYVQGTLDYGLQLFSSILIIVAYSDVIGTASHPLLYLTPLCLYCDIAECCVPCLLFRIQLSVPRLIEIDIPFCWDIGCYWAGSVWYLFLSFQYADIFTKGLPSALFDEFRDSLSVRCTPAPTMKEC